MFVSDSWESSPNKRREFRQGARTSIQRQDRTRRCDDAADTTPDGTRKLCEDTCDRQQRIASIAESRDLLRVARFNHHEPCDQFGMFEADAKDVECAEGMADQHGWSCVGGGEELGDQRHQPFARDDRAGIALADAGSVPQDDTMRARRARRYQCPLLERRAEGCVEEHAWFAVAARDDTDLPVAERHDL